MKSLLSAVVAVSVCLTPWNPASAQDTEQRAKTEEILESAGKRLMRGDSTALDDVKALPGDDAVAGLLMFFKQYYYVYSSEVEQKAIAKKAAVYITECPTAKAYITRLFKKEAGRKPSGLLNRYRETTLDSLSDAANPFAVNLLFELMKEPDLEVPVSEFTFALSKMDLPDAPFNNKTRKSSLTPEGIAKWEEWWKANKEKYTEKAPTAP